jgi:peptide deformylase
MVQKIIDAKNPILRQKSKPVAKIDKKIRALAKDLLDTVRVQKDPEGVGLAAVQIAKPVSMFAMQWKGDFRIIINPQILSLIKERKQKNKKQKPRAKTILEGCLSVPNIYGPLKRPQKLKLKFMDLEGKTRIETFEGFSAQIVQHEVDHLKGILFTDKLLKEKSPLYRYDSHTDNWEEVELI